MRTKNLFGGDYLPNIFDGIVVEGLAMFAGGEQVEPISRAVIEEMN